MLAWRVASFELSVCFTFCQLERSATGGASLSEASMRACVIGALAAMPLVAGKEILWTAEAQKLIPVLQNVRDTQVQTLAPLISGMSSEQVGVILFMDVVPSLMLLLNGTLGTMRVITELCSSSFFGPPVSEQVTAALAVLAAAYFASVVKGLEWNSSTEQSKMVQTELKQVDSSCPLTSLSLGQTSDDVAADAAAFRAVACTWLASRNMALKLQHSMTTVEFIYLGTLWHITGDMCAPIVASLMMHAVDFARLKLLLDSDSLPGKLV